MSNNLFILILFWGVWIIIPVAFDGILTFVYMLYIIFSRKRKSQPLDFQDLPKVSIIIPTYNEQDNINECLSYLKIQSYPHEKMEIIVVDNGSTDATSSIVKLHMKDMWDQNQGTSFSKITNKLKVNGQSFEIKKFEGILRLIIRQERGKANALNTGIRLAEGEIIINIDCRSFLAPDAIYNMVKKLFGTEYGAATGNIEIDWNLLYQRHSDGQYIFDADGHYIPRLLSRKEKFLGKSQFLEYLTSFRLGRQFQDITGSMYTFSGAFSAFKRDVLLKTNLYSSRTVAEDTDITLDLHGQHVLLGFAEDAKAYLKPVISYERFYAQRIRWHRGQIEVIGVHLDWYANFAKGFGRAFWHSLLLMLDHTFGFPRIVWTFLLPFFFLFGYSMTLILEAILIMYVFYVLVDFLNACFCYRVADRETKTKIKNTLHYVFVTPIFRLMTFYFRFAGYLDVLKEQQSWSTPYSPVRSTKKGFRRLYHVYNNLSQSKFARFLGLPPAPKLLYDETIAELDSFGVEKTNKSAKKELI